MPDFTTNYMGLELKNPIIVGASNLVKDIGYAKSLQDAGAAAIVYKTLFEEQINLESSQMDDLLHENDHLHAEMERLFPTIEHAGPKEHLHELKKLKDSLDIPVIGSLNAIFEETWVEYAQLIEETGVDGLELNLFSIPRKIEMECAEIIKKQLNIVKKIQSKVNIPVSVKLSPFYSNTLNVVHALDKMKVDAFVMFNRMFEPEIDIEQEKHFFPFNLSNKGDYRLSLRYAGLLSGEIKGSICANTGIFDAEDVIKLLLAGTDTVQIVSTLYKNKPVQIERILEGIADWMNRKGYKNLDDFRGKLSRKNTKDPFVYKRAQYVDILLSSEEKLKY